MRLKAVDEAIKKRLIRLPLQLVDKVAIEKHHHTVLDGSDNSRIDKIDFVFVFVYVTGRLGCQDVYFRGFVPHGHKFDLPLENVCNKLARQAGKFATGRRIRSRES